MSEQPSQISCINCGHKNASVREKCMYCGAHLLVPPKAEAEPKPVLAMDVVRSAIANNRYDQVLSHGHEAVGILLEHWDKCGRDGIEPQLLFTIGKIEDPRIRERVIASLQSKRAAIREAAARALTAIGWEPEDSESKAALLIATGRIKDARQFGSAAVKPLLPLLKSKKAAIREAAARALTAIGWQPEDSESKAVLLIAAGRIEDARELGSAAVEPLLSLLVKKSELEGGSEKEVLLAPNGFSGSAC